VTPTDPLDELEDRLRRRPVPVLPPGLRDRVLADVNEVARPSPAASWRFAAGLAAAVMAGLNLALMAANGPLAPRFGLPRRASLASTEGAPVAPRFGCPWLPCDLRGGR
jgi:hypothetical protein